MTDLERILNMAVRMNAHDVRKVIEIFQGRLRELGEVTGDEELAPRPARRRRPPWTAHVPANGFEAWQRRRDGLELQATVHLPDQLDTCKRCGLIRADHAGPKAASFDHHFVDEGAELQARLEEALRRDQDSS